MVYVLRRRLFVSLTQRDTNASVHEIKMLDLNPLRQAHPDVLKQQMVQEACNVFSNNRRLQMNFFLKDRSLLLCPRRR